MKRIQILRSCDLQFICPFKFIFLNSSLHYAFDSVNIPLFVLHGTEDVVTMPLGSQLLVSGARSRDKELIQIKGKKHHLILDIGGEQVVNTIVQWVNARL